MDRVTNANVNEEGQVKVGVPKQSSKERMAFSWLLLGADTTPHAAGRNLSV